jgi:hypothetical protein
MAMHEKACCEKHIGVSNVAVLVIQAVAAREKNRKEKSCP